MSRDIVMSHPSVRKVLAAEQRKQRLRDALKILGTVAFILGCVWAYSSQIRERALQEHLAGCTAQMTNNLGDGYVDYHVRCPDKVSLGLPESLPARRDPGFAVDRGL